MSTDFKFEITTRPQPVPVCAGDGVIRLRHWQPDAFKLAETRFVIFNAAGSAGKTTLQIALAIHDAAQGRKQIIITPQEVICDQFMERRRIKVDGVIHDWAPTDLTGETAKLRDWLLTPSTDIVVTTHAALTRVHDKLNPAQRASMYENTTLRIDESHHVHYSDAETNKLGQVVKSAFETPGSMIHMTTATDFRHEGAILPDEVRKDFEKYRLPFDKLWQWLGIKNFELLWESYTPGGNPLDAVLARLRTEPQEYHLIFVPHANKGWRRHNPKGLQTLLESLLTIFAPDQILDLTSGDSQAANKKILTKKGAPGVNVMLSCEVGREGMTWSPCSRLHITSEDQSPVRVAQTLYRLFRPYPGKTKTICCNYIPHVEIETVTKREHLTDINNAVLALLLVEEMFFPIAIETESGSRKPSLSDAFGDSWEEIKADLLMRVEAMPDLRAKALTQVLDAIMVDAGVPVGDQKRVRAALRRFVATMKACRDPKMMKAIHGMDASALRTQAGFDKVVEDLHLNEVCIHTTKHMDAKTMAEYRESIASLQTNTIAEWVRVAEDLAKENGGPLPNVYWLQSKGYVALDGAMRRNPEAFAHLKQEVKYKTVEEHVIVAEALAKKNGGVIPSTHWLRNNGYGILIEPLHDHPEAFAHLNREIRFTTLAQHVVVAEALAKKNGGRLPAYIWLIKNGQSRLHGAMRRNPEAFAHLKQEVKQKTVAEHVIVAENLAKKNGGLLPHKAWLKNHRHAALLDAIYKSPEAFAHLKQEVKQKTVAEHVIVAENLAKKNGGLLPDTKWLKNNGYGSILSRMYAHPEAFAHLKRERKTKSVAEHVLDAEDLAKENGSLLPYPKWLRNNGYNALNVAMKMNPKAFAHLKQENKRRKTLAEQVLIAEDLAAKNGGRLPTRASLGKKGYWGLVNQLQVNPKAFAHLKQEDGRHDWVR